MSGILKLYLLGDLPRLRNEVPATFTPAVKVRGPKLSSCSGIRKVRGMYGRCAFDVIQAWCTGKGGFLGPLSRVPIQVYRTNQR